MQTLSVNGYDIAYIEIGHGPPLVCVHGTLGDFLRLWKRDPDDEAFADDLERANSQELPNPNPWPS